MNVQMDRVRVNQTQHEGYPMTDGPAEIPA